MVEEPIPGLDLDLLTLWNLDNRFLRAQDTSRAATASTNSNSVGASNSGDPERLPSSDLMIYAVETNYRTRKHA